MPNTEGVGKSFQADFTGDGTTQDPVLARMLGNSIAGFTPAISTELSTIQGYGRGRVTVKPSAGFYNLFNFSNFDLPTSVLSCLIAGTAGTINAADPAAHNTDRVRVGTGLFHTRVAA